MPKSVKHSDDDAVAPIPKSVEKVNSVAKKLFGTTVRPKTSFMVLSAIGNLNEKRGSSLQAIKKYLTVTYNLDPNSYLIKKYIKKAVINGELIQLKGKGATGSFKLPPKPTIKEKPPKLPSNKGTVIKKPMLIKPISVKVASKKVTAGVVKKIKVKIDPKIEKNTAVNIKPVVSKAKTVKSPKSKTKSSTIAKPGKMVVKK